VATFGMAGHLFYSEDRGETWIPSESNRDQLLFGGALLSDGSICVVGRDGVILRSQDRAKTFTPLPNQYRGPGMAMVELQKDVLVVVGLSGVSRIEINNPSDQK